jgi:formylglycine-generating enzyme required for sulfatase activity
VTASELYADSDLELAPQMGLVPIGMNPRSKLWEFYHLRSAWDADGRNSPASIEIPEHNETGMIDMDDRGIVFVLIPGGRFLVGAQSRTQSAPNYDSETRLDTVREVELGPFLLAKHELTQGQWARLNGGEYPSYLKLGAMFDGIPVPISDSHPVEQVSWPMCQELLGRYGLLIPTEVQWERGCRAGTSTQWFTGSKSNSLEGYANVRDRTGQNVPPVWSGGEEFDDWFKGPAPVGTYGPNPFGLCDVHGNVAEWCGESIGNLDADAPMGEESSDAAAASNVRVGRGGGYSSPGVVAGVNSRRPYAVAIRDIGLGVRPARDLGR